MTVPAVDFEGTGALQYLRVEIAARREIVNVLPAVPVAIRYVRSPQNQILVALNAEISRPFDAAANLKEILSPNFSRVRTQQEIVLAAAALERLQLTLNEDTDRWATRLSSDLSKQHD